MAAHPNITLTFFTETKEDYSCIYVDTCMIISYIVFVLYTEDVGDEGEEEKECITYNVSIDIHYGIKSNR